MALATIRAETSSFLPISEKPSRFNTSPGVADFSAAYNTGLEILPDRFAVLMPAPVNA
ncbi:MAG: hypothetical protein JOZ32_17030 [Bryobacterales bacterium]|nr:hypothetical protein [Bryobacterales bacterium]